MKINPKILSIPPYISTTWDNVSGLFYDERGDIFHITLKNNAVISIPKLPRQVRESAFQAHQEHLEKYERPGQGDVSLLANLKLGHLNPAELNLENLGAFTGMMQHDPSQKEAPDLPREILDRISQVAKALGLDQNGFDIPDGEPHCNCTFCQIARVLHGHLPSNEAKDDELVEDEELSFREWDIKQSADKLYEVINPLDYSEHYQVYLGQPIGCTCGKNNCEHILAVLNS